MHECPKMRECAFFSTLLADESSLAGLFRQRYCRSKSHECARMVLATAGGDVPDDLFPNQDKRARELITAIPRARTA